MTTQGPTHVNARAASTEGTPLNEAPDERARFAQRLPRAVQPALTWLSGKALPHQAPLFPWLCAPVAKVCVAAMTTAVALAIGTQAVVGLS